MLISAISANQTTSATRVGAVAKVKTKKQDNADTSFNSLQSSAKSSQEKKLAEIYNSINEWKTFCHEQILNGKLDIIA